MRRRWSLFAIGFAAFGACSDPYSAGDAPVPPSGDAAADAVVDREPVADASCAPCDATFCEDFDCTQFPPAGWRVDVTESALSLGDAGVSAPFALQAENHTIEARRERHAFLVKRAPVVSSLECSFSVKPVDLPFAALAFVLQGQSPSVATWRVVFEVSTTGTYLRVIEIVDGGSSPKAYTAPILPLRAWSRITLRTDLTKARMEIDGVAIGELPFSVPPGTSSVDIMLGAQVYDAAKHVLLFDDVRCTINQ